MLNRQQKLGREGESMAVRYLKKQGYKILERNYRTPVGEIDIIAKAEKTITFVEVKTRSTAYPDSPKSAVTPQKQRKISMAALTYLKATAEENTRARFDVIAIKSSSATSEIEWVKNAFELAYP